MAKNNIRSIRMSDRVVEIVDAQQGENFTAKFENLVIRCMWELPDKEKQLEQLNEQIAEKREELRKLSVKATSFSRQLSEMQYKMSGISNAIAALAKSTDTL